MDKFLDFLIKYPIIPAILKILITLIITKLTIKYSIKVVDKAVNVKLLENEPNTNRIETLGNVAKSILRYSIYFISAIICLTIVFGPIPLTFAGVGAAIIGFGSQSLIKDITSGFFLLFEGQYAIGDHITIENNEGIVEAVELRVTKIRAFNGDLYIIPNGSIIQVTNHSNGPHRFEILVTVDFNSNGEMVESVLNDCCKSLNDINQNVLEPAKLVGISSFTNTGITYRILGKCKPLSRIQVEAELREYIRSSFKIYNIKFATISNK